jgi:hypothetical protein
MDPSWYVIVVTIRRATAAAAVEPRCCCDAESSWNGDSTFAFCSFRALLDRHSLFLLALYIAHTLYPIAYLAISAEIGTSARV